MTHDSCLKCLLYLDSIVNCYIFHLCEYNALGLLSF